MGRAPYTDEVIPLWCGASGMARSIVSADKKRWWSEGYVATREGIVGAEMWQDGTRLVMISGGQRTERRYPRPFRRRGLERVAYRRASAHAVPHPGKGSVAIPTPP